MRKNSMVSVRGKKGNKPNPVDVFVGSRMKLRRTILGFSQHKTAQKLGLTVQQYQKYEKGANRVGASRLFDIAQVLQTSIGFFFENMDNKTKKQSPMHLKIHQNIDFVKDYQKQDPMLKEETLRIIVAYYKIKNKEVAQHFLALLEFLSSC